MARGAFPDRHPPGLGMPGMHGNYTAVTAHAARRPARQPRARASTTGSPARSAPSPPTPRSSTSTSTRPSSARCGVPEVAIAGDCRLVIEELLAGAWTLGGDAARSCRDLAPWWRQIREWQERLPAPLRRTPTGAPSSRRTSSRAARRRPGRHDRRGRASASTRCGPRSTGTSSTPTPGSTPVVRAPWASPSPPPSGPRWAGRTRTVWAIDGDGCFQMTAQELVTAQRRADPGEDRHLEQRLPGHGAPVAGDVLRGALLGGLPLARPARLREVGRGHGLRRASGPRRPRRWGRRSRRRTPSTTVPSSSTSAPTPSRRCSRWCPAGASNDDIVVHPDQTAPR